jgi:hypoxanthine phosphoribosyltransferase
VPVQPFELLLDQKRLSQRIAELGRQITADYHDQSVLLIGVLKGCMVFLADLIRHINLPTMIDFVAFSSPPGSARTEQDLMFVGGAQPKVRGRHVLLVEGIVDTARTASLVVNRLQREEPASLEIVTLLDKPTSHRTKVAIKYRGFAVGNEFVIGFGLDNAQMYRNLPFVGKVIED